MIAHPRIELDGLTVLIERNGVATTLVTDVNLSVASGRTLAIVGESGSGKSLTALSIMRLLEPNLQLAGAIRYRTGDDQLIDLTTLDDRAMRAVRGKEISMIFQDPMRSLNPVLTVGDQIGEKLIRHDRLSRVAARARSIELLRSVEIPAADRRVDDYPHQMSGGMRQRVMIAMALACDPSLLIADEPTTALDVTIQAQILDVLRKLQAERGMTMIFITHNLGVVAEIAHDVAVMYSGSTVETAGVAPLFAEPRHPYTQALIQCVPSLQKLKAGAGGYQLRPITGALPSPFEHMPGCRFARRCDYAVDRCRAEFPALLHAGEARASRCWEWPRLAQDEQQ